MIMTSWYIGELSGEAGSGVGTYGDCGVTGCLGYHVVQQKMQLQMMVRVFMLTG